MTLILLCSCVTTTTTIGVPSCLYDKGHEGNTNNTYMLTEIANRNEVGWEFNLGVILYKVDDENFEDFNVGVKKYFTKKWKYTYIEAGIGARFTGTDGSNPWLADSNLLADVSLGVGVRQGAWSIGYTFQHLSVPWRHDYGLNFDAITVKYRF